MSLTLTVALVLGNALFAEDAPPGPPPPPPPPQEEPGVRLAEDAPRAATLESMTEDQLVARLSTLKKDRPTLVGPIVMLSIGGVLAIPGVYFLIATLEVAGKTAATMNGFVALFGAVAGVILGVISAIFIIPAAVLLIIGGITLPLRLSAIGDRNEEIDDIERRLRAMPAREVGPPPPLPPPMTNFVVPGPLQPVAAF